MAKSGRKRLAKPCPCREFARRRSIILFGLENEEKDRKELEARINKFRASERKPGEFSPWQGLSLLGSLGFVVAASIVLGIVAGVYLDQKWNTKPLFTLIGLFLGLGAAGFGGYELVRSVWKGKE